MAIPAIGRTAAVCAILALTSAACKKEPETRPKPPKKEAAAARASQERQALNTVARLLRELASPAPEPGTTPAARAAAVFSKLQSVPASDLPDSLRAPWQEMTAVLEAAARSGSSNVPAEIRQRGEAAAAALNAALAGEGLTDFRF